MEALKKNRNRLVVSDKEIKDNEKVYGDYSKDYLENFCRYILAPIRKVWYRAEFIGFDDLPQRNNPDSPLVYISNHSGMAFPWDAIIFVSEITDRKYPDKDCIRAFISPMLTKNPYMCPFIIDNLWWKMGCIHANLLNFETGMKLNRSNLLIFPEGICGIGKGFDKRYELQPFKTSFVRMSVRYKTDVIPFYTVNGEFNNPLAYNFKPLTKFVRKCGMPFFPLGPVILLSIFQPWIFYTSLPSKLTFIIGRPLKVYDMVKDKPYEDFTQEELKVTAEEIRGIMQKELSLYKEKYGGKFYDIKGLLKSMWENRRQFFKYFPAFWPITMTYFDVNFDETQGAGSLKFSFKKCLKTIFKRPIVLAMYLPVFGWFFIWLRNRHLNKRDRQQHR